MEILSVRPSSAIARKNIQFSVVFPCREVDSYRVTELVFNSAKFYIDPVVRNIIQNRKDFSDDSMLKIKFVGLNVSTAIQSILNKDEKLTKEILSSLNNDRNLENDIEKIPETRFQKVLEKRLALTSLVINESKKTEDLGRVKLAKIFYLADQHLNLGMEGNYTREAAGPLDQRLIYNENIGIEAQGERLSYFNTVEQNKRQGMRVRYVPSTNFKYILERSEKIFIDKYVNVLSLLRKLIPLNTEQSEIVATLYACWNDLLILKKEVTDEEIIFDFLNKWHSSKSRFKKEKLFKALEWMRNEEIVPLGIGRRTLQKQDKIPSGF